MTAFLPVTARAVASAMVLPSVPELVKRTRSIDGKRAQTSAANRSSQGLAEPKTIPASSARSTASRSTGCEWP